MYLNALHIISLFFSYDSVGVISLGRPCLTSNSLIDTGLLVWKAVTGEWDVLCYNFRSQDCWSSKFPLLYQFIIHNLTVYAISPLIYSLILVYPEDGNKFYYFFLVFQLIISCRKGGTSIEDLAEKFPDMIVKVCFELCGCYFSYASFLLNSISAL